MPEHKDDPMPDPNEVPSHEEVEDALDKMAGPHPELPDTDETNE